MSNIETKWDGLAKENPYYFTKSEAGLNPTNKEYSETGAKDVNDKFLSDPVISKKLKDMKNPTILEIGCGIGRMSEFLNKSGSLIAVDISDEMIKMAKERLPEVNFIKAESTKLPCRAKSIDVVFSFLAFNHFPSLEYIKKSIVEASRVLRKDGVMKIHLRGFCESGNINPDQPLYGYAAKEEEIFEICKELGLEVLRLVRDVKVPKQMWLTAKKI